MAKTRQEIEKLKAEWLTDPVWDIENTPGYEEHKDELIQFSLEQNAIWDKRAAERKQKRIDKVRDQAGIFNKDIASSLYLWNEIESSIRQVELISEDYSVDVAMAQTRATLFLAAQVKRVADALEELSEGDSLSESVRIFGSEQ